MKYLPTPVEELVENLVLIPGVSKKQAEKMAYYFVEEKTEQVEKILDSIKNSNKLVDYCNECQILTDKKICSICTDKNREKILVVVEKSADVFKIEQSQKTNSYYFVLNGLVKVNQKEKLPSLNTSKFLKKVQSCTEVIIALSPNLEGIVTANFLKNLVPDKKVTQLAIGIPLGAAMEYVDEISLKNAFENRREVK